MKFESRRSRLGDLAFWLALASSTLIVLTLLVSEIGSLLGAPPEQLSFSLMIGAGIALGLVCAFAGVVSAHVSRRQEAACRRVRSALVVYCILGSLAALAVFGTVTLIAIAHG